MYAGIVIKIPSKNTFIIDPLGSLNLSEYTKNKMPLNDEQRLLDQIDPNILNPFKDIPYTHSLSSFAY